MIRYLDSNALVKLFVDEPGSVESNQAISDAYLVGTALISRVEVVAAFGKARRLGVLSPDAASSARHYFQLEWPHYFHLQTSGSLMDRAADLAWSYGLRGYDAVQLAAAADWSNFLDVPVSMVTFDVRLWKAAALVGLEPYPADLPGLVQSWKA